MPEITSELDPNTPILVGVGQAAERLDDPDYAALGEADLSARAVTAAFADAGIDAAQLAEAVDTVAAVRSFEVSTPMSAAPLGRPDNMPRAVSRRVGMDPARAIAEVTGGQSPQSLLTELAGEIAAGNSAAAVIFGAEVISTVRHIQSLPEGQPRPDFTEKIGGQLEDRGFGIRGLTSVAEVRHGLAVPINQYAVLENARRHRVGLGREEYARAMGELFAPMSTIAAANPYSAAPTERSAHELATVTESNRMLSEPFTRLIVARDQVNQAAACVVMSVATATALGIDPDRWVFLHGHADLREQPLMKRPDLSAGPASIAAIDHALDVADVGFEDLSHLDIYSCFPIAVFNVCDAYGLSADDPRGLTVTGGLPFFGGPGNNYSMHAIAEIAHRVRNEPGSYGLVAANGGVMSKYSVGIYSTTPTAWRADHSIAIQKDLDAVPTVPTQSFAQGPATIESYTITYDRKGRANPVIIGRLDLTGRRFIAAVERGDEQMLALLTETDDPIGSAIYAHTSAKGNRVTVSRDALMRSHPPVKPGFREEYEHVLVRRDGHLLEVTINRPDARNALNPDANAELDSIFDAYFADPDLWVAILTGAGDKSFSAGNDLAQTAGPSGLDVPQNGFAGLTSRPHLPKPVIAAVNGFALGGGCEIAMSCHLIVADENAVFGLPEVKVGLIAAAGGLVRLPAAVPGALARDMILTGRRLSAAEALDAGLVSRVAPAGGSLELARTVAAEILAASPTSVRASLEAMETASTITDPIEAIDATGSALDSLLVSADTLEGIMAFVTKREPQWKGH